MISKRALCSKDFIISFQQVVLYFEDLVNPIDFFEGIFLHIIPVGL